MKQKYTFQDVILSFSKENTPCPADAFRVLSKAIGQDPKNIENWYYRNRIPPQHWDDVLHASQRTPDTLWQDRDFVMIASRYE